jgi:tetratricopeptide (TPR) repeat protein
MWTSVSRVALASDAMDLVVLEGESLARSEAPSWWKAPPSLAHAKATHLLRPSGERVPVEDRGVWLAPSRGTFRVVMGPLAPGDSGSPLVDGEGLLVGIALGISDYRNDSPTTARLCHAADIVEVVKAVADGCGGKSGVTWQQWLRQRKPIGHVGEAMARQHMMHGDWAAALAALDGGGLPAAPPMGETERVAHSSVSASEWRKLAEALLDRAPTREPADGRTRPERGWKAAEDGSITGRLVDAIRLRRSQSYEAAVSALEEVSRHDRSSMLETVILKEVIHLSRGLVSSQQEDLLERALQVLMDRMPWYPGAAEAYAWSLSRKGRHEAAIDRALRLWCQREPDNEMAHMELSAGMWRAGRHDEAISSLVEFSDRVRASAGSRAVIALMELAQGRVERAEYHVELLARLDSDAAAGTRRVIQRVKGGETVPVKFAIGDPPAWLR